MKFSVKIKLFLWVLSIVSFVTLIGYIIYRGNIFLNGNIILGFYLLLLTTVVATYFIYQYFKRLVNSAAQLIAKNNMDDPSVASEEIFDELLKESSQVEDELVYYTQQTEQFSSVLSKMGQGVILVDKNYQVLYLNKTINTEFFPDLNIGDKLFENISYPQFKKFVEKAWNKKDLVREISGPISIKTVYLVSAKKDDIRDEMLIVFSDISKSKNFEKMREDFIGNVSHELRTPISVIKANAETLIENKLIKDDENAKLFTEAIFSQSERMTVIVNDLLKISSMEAGEYPISIESINSFSITKNLIEEFKPNLDKKKLTVQNNLNENTKVMADEAALKLILTNFLSNAIKHSPKKAFINLTESSSSKGFIRLSVSDEGKGVPKKYKERVFERFYRIDKGRSSETGGTGLGLSISKNLALMMGYSVGVEANEPKGATFFIDIKVDEEKSIQAA
ncbi:HAMP domain-containing histidine kinase [SAR86 cluster bacterium]|jgi:two-component system phosphate regulon sensor histidine kinase PhoR|nr:HAMP domain-containing histidine kinase [SAR86 cluster bacterium]